MLVMVGVIISSCSVCVCCCVGCLILLVLVGMWIGGMGSCRVKQFFFLIMFVSVMLFFIVWVSCCEIVRFRLVFLWCVVVCFLLFCLKCWKMCCCCIGFRFGFVLIMCRYILFVVLVYVVFSIICLCVVNFNVLLSRLSRI